MKNKLKLIYTTVSSKEDAEKLAEQAIEKKYAACVNIIVGIASVYEWEGKVVNAEEHVLLFKTSPSKADILQQWLIEHHPYSVPAIVKGEVESTALFLDFIKKQTD